MSLVSVPLEEGLAFDTGSDSVYAVQDYAMALGKAVSVSRASGADRRMVCASPTPCGFFVQVYRQRMSDKKTYGKWYIASMELAHSETCQSVRRLTTRQIAILPAFMEAVLANPKASVESLVARVLEEHGVSLEKQIRLVYRARELVRSGKPIKTNILASQDSPLPPRQFVRRYARDKTATSPESGPGPKPKQPKHMERMSWTDIFIESLLIERIVKHGKDFIEAGEQSQHRALWETIHKEFNAMHDVDVSVTQLRAKFRYLQDQYLKVRADEEETARYPDKLVVYPRCWDMLVEYFGGEVFQNSPNVSVECEEAIVTETSGSQAPNAPIQSTTAPVVRPAPAFVLSAPVQSVPGYSTPVRAIPQTQIPIARQVPSPVRSDEASKRRRINPVETSAAVEQGPRAVAPSYAVPASATSDVAEKLESIQSTQSEMARSMDGMKQVVEQSNEAIRGLQQTLNQSNQVNAALLDFLRRQPSA